jgi:predicted dehydrogenase
MSAPLRVAVIGAGYFAQFQIAAWRDLPGAELAALCDIDADRASRSLERDAGAGHGIAVHDRAEAMLAPGAFDIIDIATPPATHAGLIRQALAAGPRMVICQKPFCGTVEAAVRATEAAEAAGIPLAVHENVRFQPWYRRIRRELDAGTLGRLYRVAMRFRPGDGQGQDAYLDRQPYFREMPRFLIHETGIHWIDTFRFLLGEPVSLYADLHRINPGIAGEDAGTVLLRFPDGVRAVFDANRAADHQAANRRHTMGDLLAEGSAGTLRLDGYGCLRLRRFGDEDETTVDQWPPDGFGAGCVRAFQQHILDHLLHGRTLETGARQYLANLAIEAAVYESASRDAGIRL